LRGCSGIAAADPEALISLPEKELGLKKNLAGKTT
jgi:hypothetical protein